jgi:hypothetical protein
MIGDGPRLSAPGWHLRIAAIRERIAAWRRFRAAVAAHEALGYRISPGTWEQLRAASRTEDPVGR